MALVVYSSSDDSFVEEFSLAEEFSRGLEDTREFSIEHETDYEYRMIDEDPNRIGAFQNTGSLDSLVGRTFESEDDAWACYQMYGKTVGFGIKKFRTRYSKSGVLVSKTFTCNKQGKKYNGAMKEKCYKKLDTRSGCGALIKFNITEGVWTVTRHEIAHNHELIDPDQVHLFRSSRKMPENDVRFLLAVKDSVIGITRGYALLTDQAQGSRNLGYTKRDAFNNVATVRNCFWDSGDANGLLEILRMKKEQEPEFYYHFEVDDEGRLCSVFWRDARMKKDYHVFGDLLVHDTTYRSTKYTLSCAPFIGMNHHTYNIMFEVGFLLHEDTKSFKWLFEEFLRSMDGKQPITIMTDECAAMGAAIPMVFHNSRHRLCVWHISENSKKYIAHLRQEDGFMVSFQNILTCIDTVSEFEYFWDKLCNEYKCGNDKWLRALYEKKEKWSRAYNKSYFSGGVVSSQRSESTNNSICRSLPKTARLCDFLKNFSRVIDGWRERERERDEDFRCSYGRIEMNIHGMDILKHASELYTHEAYIVFEKQYSHISSCTHSSEPATEDGVEVILFRVNRNEIDYFGHQVKFYPHSTEVVCTCGLFGESGFLCTHCLLVYFIKNVQKVPDQYILPRYRKGANVHCLVGSSIGIGTSDFSTSCLWRSDMINKFIRIVSSAERNDNAKKIIEEGLNNSLKLVESEIGGIVDDTGSIEKVKDPVKLRPKGERNKRFKSTFEVRAKKAKGKKKKEATIRTKRAVYNKLSSENNQLVGQLINPLQMDTNFICPTYGSSSRSDGFHRVNEPSDVETSLHL